MLRLPPFKLIRPATVAQAAAALDSEGPRARLVAGGTDLWPKMKRRQMEPDTVVALRHLTELAQIAGLPGEGMTLGANLTLRTLERDPVLIERYPAMAAAARSISSPPLKTMGTLGGNLCVDTRCNYYDQTYEWRKSISFCMKKEGEICWVAPSSPRCWAVSSTDLAPVMLALGATIRLVSVNGARAVAASDFYRNDGIEFLTRQPNEIVTAVDLPPVNGDRMVFSKLRRRGSIDFPILNVAVWARPAGDVVEDIRIAVGGITSAPFLAEGAAALLRGGALTEDRIREAADAAVKVSRPLDNTDLNFSWRRKMVAVWVRRALHQLAANSE